jgi:hypothetical protein
MGNWAYYTCYNTERRKEKKIKEGAVVAKWRGG